VNVVGFGAGGYYHEGMKEHEGSSRHSSFTSERRGFFSPQRHGGNGGSWRKAHLPESKCYAHYCQVYRNFQ